MIVLLHVRIVRYLALISVMTGPGQIMQTFLVKVFQIVAGSLFEEDNAVENVNCSKHKKNLIDFDSS